MSRYTVYILPDEFRSIKRLPGQMRQRVKHAIDKLPTIRGRLGARNWTLRTWKTRVARFDACVWTIGESCIWSTTTNRRSMLWRFGNDRHTTTVIWQSC